MQNSGIAPDMQQIIEDLLFDGWFLLSEKTDEALRSFKGARTML